MLDKLQAFREFFMKALPLSMGALLLALTVLWPDAPGASVEVFAYAAGLASLGGLAFWSPRQGYFILGPYVACGIIATGNWELRSDTLLTAVLALTAYWLYGWSAKSRMDKQ